MAKFDIIYDTKAGRVFMGALAFFLLAAGLVLFVFSILLGQGESGGFWETLLLGVACIAYGVWQITVLKKRKPQVAAAATPEPEPEKKPEPAPLPGEPDDLIVVNPTRVNEPDGAILLYRKEGLLVYDGERIPIDRIVDAYVTNVTSNPYVPAVYHILLNLNDGNVAHIPAGQDAAWAQEALKQLQEACASRN